MPTISVTTALIRRLRAFEDRPGPSLASQLEPHVGTSLDPSDVLWLYVDAVIGFLDETKGPEMGPVFFVDEIKHATDRHLLWFCLASPDRETFLDLCGRLERELSSKDPDYVYQYYRSCSPPTADSRLSAQFELVASAAFRAEDAKPIPGAVVYAWSPPGAFLPRE